MSPVLYAGAIGLPLVLKRHRLAGIAMIVAFLAMVYFNSILQDWWGSEGFGGRRFDGTIPLLIVGLACAIDAIRRLIARAAWAPSVLLLIAAAAWELTFQATMHAGVAAGDRPNDFGVVSAAQADTWHRWVGHPFAYPANLLFAAANAEPIADYDLVDAGSFLGDPNQPYGRIDVGAAGDTVYVREGFSDSERDGPTTYRWADDGAALIIPLRRSARLRVELRLRTAAGADAPPLQVTVRINDHAFGPVAAPVDWQTIAFVTERDVWRTTINRVTFGVQRAGEAGAQGSVPDPQRRVAVDFIRVREEGR
jgi:hypothetical protein